MRYLLNLPLVLVLVGLWRVFDVTVLREGQSDSVEAAFETVFGTAIYWLLLAVVLTTCGTMGELRWPQAQGVGGFMVALLGCGAALLVSLLPIGIALETHAAAKWGIDQVGLARLTAFGLPLVLACYGAWMVNAPAETRAAAAPHVAALGVVGLLCLLAAIVSVRELSSWDRVAQANAVDRGEAANQQAAAQRQALDALTETDPLAAWDAYIGENVPADVRAEALRRIAARPQLDAELAQILADENPNWSAEALRLIAKVPFTPSPALEQPVRDGIAALAARLAREAPEVSRDGDKRLDLYEAYTLGVTLEVAERMAQGARVDLGPSIDAVARAVALYPSSDAARAFPGKVAETKRHIAEYLAARHG